MPPRGHSGRYLVSRVPVKVLEVEEGTGMTREEFLGKETFTLKPSLVSLDPQHPVKSQAWQHEHSCSADTSTHEPV